VIQVPESQQTKLYAGELSDLEKVMKYLRQRFNGVTFMGYKLQNSTPVFGEIHSLSDMPIKVSDIQRPGYYELVAGYRFRLSYASPKWYLLPPEHSILRVLPNYEVVNAVNNSPVNKVVMFGIKPCDFNAIAVLDAIVAGKHSIYTKRRSSVVAIIIEECLEPAETCFCSITGTGPTVLKGYDLAYARLDENTVIFKPGSTLGEEIIKAASLREAVQGQVETYYSAVERAINIMTTRLPRIEEIQRALKKSVINEKLWKTLSERCTGCGNCNYVCPTCFCIEIVDRVEESYTIRTALWAACRTYTYGLVAGGHFRRDLYTRYRHFVLHKFLFYSKQTRGLLGCVGCGRCATWCPLGLDLKETLVRVVKEVE